MADEKTTGWQPIATAPRDGTWLLIAGGEPGYGWDESEFVPPAVVACWGAEEQVAINDEHSPGADAWRFAVYDSGYYGLWENPTHWMPLPEPPHA
jgi:hypothetical protein